MEASEAKKQVHMLNDKIAEKQEKNIASLELYFKYYNLKLFNIIESPNENTNLLLEKIWFVLREMEIDSSKTGNRQICFQIRSWHGLGKQIPAW